MNDRFKFRYWHTKENRYIYTQCDCLAIMNTVLYSLISKPNKGGWYETDIEKAYNDFELIPEQCTGLKDKNGNLIYEGDILLLRNNKFEVGHNNITVFFKCLTDEYTHIDPMDFDYDESEIIGNIHEQTEQKE